MAKKNEYATKESWTITKGGIILVKAQEHHSHAACEYNIVSDDIVSDDLVGSEENGDRVLVLRKKDLNPHYAAVDHLVDLLMRGMGSADKILRGIVRDSVIDLTPERIEELRMMVEDQGKKVKPAEGCYKLMIGDGRRTKGRARGTQLMLRD